MLNAVAVKNVNRPIVAMDRQGNGDRPLWINDPLAITLREYPDNRR